MHRYSLHVCMRGAIGLCPSVSAPLLRNFVRLWFLVTEVRGQLVPIRGQGPLWPACQLNVDKSGSGMCEHIGLLSLTRTRKLFFCLLTFSLILSVLTYLKNLMKAMTGFDNARRCFASCKRTTSRLHWCMSNMSAVYHKDEVLFWWQSAKACSFAR